MTDSVPKTPPRTPSRRAASARRKAPKIGDAVLSPDKNHLGLTPKSTALKPRGRQLQPRVTVDEISGDSSAFLRCSTSREIAEVIALIKSSGKMRVIEVSEVITESTFGELVSLGCPVIFRGYAKGWGCVKKWSEFNYLKAAAAKEALALPHRKYRQFVAQSVEQGRLHLTDGKSKAKAVSIEEFLNSCLVDQSSANGLYLLGIHSVHSGSSALTYCPVQAHEDDHNVTPPLSSDVPKSVQLLEWYAEILGNKGATKTPVKYDHQQFFLANGYAFTDLHYDSYDNFYVAVSGIRRWTLACPSASRWLIDSSGGKLKSGSACVPHLKLWSQKGAPAQIYPFGYVELRPGDMLFVPACWWHLVESKTEETKDSTDSPQLSCAFNYFFSKPVDEVFGQFQEGLANTDALVAQVQTEVRARIAEGGRSSVGDSVPKEIQTAPDGIEKTVWSSVTKTALTYGVKVEELEQFHNKLNTHSITQWVGKSSSTTNETKKGRAKSNTRTAVLSG